MPWLIWWHLDGILHLCQHNTKEKSKSAYCFSIKPSPQKALKLFSNQPLWLGSLPKHIIQLFLDLWKMVRQHLPKGPNGFTKNSSSQCELVSWLACPHQAFVLNQRLRFWVSAWLGWWCACRATTKTLYFMLCCEHLMPQWPRQPSINSLVQHCTT